MKVFGVLLPLLVSSAQALGSSLACVNAFYKSYKQMDGRMEYWQSHVCEKGCVLSQNEYTQILTDQHLRPALREIFARHFPRQENPDVDIDELVKLGDEFIQVVVDTCGEGHPDKGDFDLCATPDSLPQCWSKIKPLMPGLALKNARSVAFWTRGNRCEDLAAAMDDPEYHKLVKQQLDNFAASCKTRS
ncbi:hypothetical protein BDV33DRAFT_209236 [Aspergillus novoparasiticus]|uniref:Uncharacterized protein n=1 Tax=Aspergillus novoparasiticus TaxID=986946 RepID=A0A5N6EA76_9EURO|nr:hypothetical protein BDV33DRAFT_209236 [Aspergillus novoparasiticus]